MSALPKATPSLLRELRQRDRAANRAGDASPFSRSGTSITAEGVAVVDGMLRSLDYDGTSPTDLGTTGWALEPDASGASRLILNGIDVYADLAAKSATLAAQVADIAALVAAQMVPAVGHDTTGVTPVATSTSPSNHADVPFTVPTGYTRAAVIGVSAITSIVRSHTCATFIDGEVGDYTECHPDEAGGSSHTRVLTGLTAGGTFSVGTQVMANVSGGYVHAMTAALALFYR